MKKIKLILTTALAMIVLLGSTGVFAYNGTDVDTKYEITMPTVLTEGKGTVTSSKTGSFKYQFVETTATKYSTLKKLAAQLELMQAYQSGEFANWEDAEANANYKAMVTKYESTYNEKVASLYTQYGSFDSNSISDVRSLWIHELPNFVAGNWTSATNNQIDLDLSTFTGTKYYVAWIQLGDMYDAEVYIVNGTMTTKDPDDNTTSDNTTSDNTTGDDNNTVGDNNTTGDNNNTAGDNNTTSDDDNTVGDNNKTDDNTIGDDNNTSDNNKSSNNTNSTGKKDTTTSGDKTITNSEKLPYTGIVENILIYGGMASSIIAAIISYRKLKNLK